MFCDKNAAFAFRISVRCRLYLCASALILFLLPVITVQLEEIMFHQRQHQDLDIKTPADLDRLIVDMNRLKICKELKKLIVYLYERKIYEQDAISRDYLNFCLASYFILDADKYEHLFRNLQLLPTKILVQELGSLVTFMPGFHNEVLELVEIKYEAFPNRARDVSLLVDELEITPEVIDFAGKCYGIVDDGVTRKYTPAKYVTKIWVKSLGAGFTDPLAYYFTGQLATAEQLKKYIFDCITKLQAINLNVVVVNTKLRSNFWELSELLGIEPDKQSFKVENKEVVFIFDAPHMMCVTRNILQKYCLKMEDGGTTSWEHIKTFFVKESESGQKKTQLTKHHINPVNYDRTMSAIAIDVLSNTVYTEMKAYVESGKLPEEALATAQCINLFDRLFDMLNSRYEEAINEYASAFRGTRWQKQYLDKAVKFLEALKVFDNQGREKTGELKFIKAWLITIRGTKKVWEILKAKEYQYLLTSVLNSEELDVCFRTFRAIVRGNITPLDFIHLHSKTVRIRYFISRILMHLRNVDTPEYARLVYKRIPAVRHNLGTPTQSMQLSVREFREIKSRLEAVCDELGLSHIPIRIP